MMDHCVKQVSKRTKAASYVFHLRRKQCNFCFLFPTDKFRKLSWLFCFDCVLFAPLPFVLHSQGLIRCCCAVIQWVLEHQNVEQELEGNIEKRIQTTQPRSQGFSHTGFKGKTLGMRLQTTVTPYHKLFSEAKFQTTCSYMFASKKCNLVIFGGFFHQLWMTWLSTNVCQWLS